MVEKILSRFALSGYGSPQSQLRHFFLEVMGGLGSIGFLGSIQDIKYPHKDANEALKYDWEMIGKDMADALERFREERTTT
jgi:hypothetical protein